jgi:hypothetical protein
MSAIETVKRAGTDLLKGAAAALASLFGLLIGGVVAVWLNLPSASIPAYVSMSALLPLMLISGTMIAIALGECFQNLSWSFWPRLLAIGLCNYLLYYLLNLLDGLLFTPIPHMTTGFFADLFPAIFAAAVIAWLWQPQVEAFPAGKIITAFFSARQWPQWTWRFLIAWVIYPPIYYSIGRVVALFTLHYYEDPSLNLGLTLPAISTLLLMQVLRGALFLLAVAPILFSWRGRPIALWLWVGSVIFIQIANQVIVQAYWLPLGLRIPHAIELMVDSFAQASFYIGLLFSLPPSSPNQATKGNATVSTDV